ncbi:hypothetical protein [Tenacibaculum ovolyticum]|uniref:hypothetical protein n=1 Tax=Tenacibaculum ovolyticum TaxID=104270 RepID=UPI0007EDF6DC|nr:hypothetical protein [Tenacibaculum ovolyticum]
MANLQRLGELIFDVAEGWKKQQVYAFDRSEMMYDTDLFDCQNANTAILPVFKDDRAVWDARITTNCGNDWCQSFISIPKWLYDMYMQGKANFISWKKIEAETKVQ